MTYWAIVNGTMVGYEDDADLAEFIQFLVEDCLLPEQYEITHRGLTEAAANEVIDEILRRENPDII